LVLNSGAKIKIPFRFIFKTPYQLAGEVIDPELPLNFKIRGTNFDNDNKMGVVDVSLDKKIKINSLVRLDTDTTYETSSIENYGGPTPKLGEEATYTIN
jgi:hypothetical protein